VKPSGTWKAKWIWCEGEPTPRNFYLCVRKALNVPRNLKSASIRITADSRYVLFLNGERLGQGPVRSWPFEQSFDTYDVSARLRPGRNVLSVLVHHFGTSTFQYVIGRGGLLCQVDLKLGGSRAASIGTDSSWRVSECEAYDRRVPRMSCQQAWSEHYDAGKEQLGWTGLDFDDTKWKPARVLGPVGMRPWAKLVERTIPLLTEEPVPPVALLRRRVVKAPRIRWCFDLKPNFLPGDLTANPRTIIGAAATIIRSSRATKAAIRHVHGPWVRGQSPLRLNCADVGVKDGIAELKLRRGDNLLIADVSGRHHDWFTTLVVECSVDLRFRAPLAKDAHWATLGPFKSDQREEFAEVLSAGSPDDLKPYTSSIRPILRDHEATESVFAVTTSAQEVADESVLIDNPNGLFSYSENAAVIYPPRKGDAELLLDFGREVVGFLEFELESPKGVVLDWNCFEFMRGNDIQHTGGLNNTLRYVSREGSQKFHSIVRRGFRYALLTVRNFRVPIKIRRIACLLNTFPVIERGDFMCSDPLLNQIWRMCRYTTRLCMEDTFVDCPAYEQTLWVGDARGEALINYVTFGEYGMPNRCWKLTGRSLHRSRLTESQVPSGWENVLTAWSLLWMLACEESYIWSGDESFLKEIYSAIAKNCKGIESFVNSRGLLEIEAWNMLDWAPMDTPPSGIVTHQNALSVAALRSAARLARILRKEGDASHYTKVAERIRGAINEHLWSDEAQAYIDSIHADGERSKVISQQTNTMVFLCDCAPPDREKIIRNYVAEVPQGWTRVGSPFAMFFTFEALARMGKFDELLRQTRDRWGLMIDEGTTTCWETFPTPGAKHFTRSYCHAWSAGPAYFLSIYQLGIRPISPGFTEALIAPQPAGLKWARGRMPTPHGEIEVSWADKGDSFEVSTRLPPHVRAELIIPVCAFDFPELDTMGEGIGVTKQRDERWVVELHAGALVEVKARRLRKGHVPQSH